MIKKSSATEEGKAERRVVTQYRAVCCVAPGKCPEPAWQRGSVVGPEGQIQNGKIRKLYELVHSTNQ